VISRTTIGRGFKGLITYQFQGYKGQETDKKAEVLTAVGVRDNSPEAMIADFNRGRRLNPDLGKPVWHTSLSFNPSDAAKLSSDKMLEIAEDYMRRMKLDNTQYVIIRHHDRPGHEHLHIIANRVANDGHTIKDNNNFYESKKILPALIKHHGLTPPEGLRLEQQQPEQLHGVERTRYELKESLRTVLATATNRSTLEQELQQQGVSCQIFRNKTGKETGISFAKDGHTLKGSAIGREYSLANISKRLDTNQAQAQQQAAKERNARWLATVNQTLAEALQTGTRKGFDNYLANYGFTYNAGAPGQPAMLRHSYGDNVEGSSLLPNGESLLYQLAKLEIAERKAAAQQAEQVRLVTERAAAEQARQQAEEAQRAAAQQYAAQEQTRQLEKQRIAAATRTLTVSAHDQQHINRVYNDLIQIPGVQIRDLYPAKELEVRFRVDQPSVAGVYEAFLKAGRRDHFLWMRDEETEGPGRIMPQLRAAATQQGWKPAQQSLDSGPRISRDRDLELD